MIEGLMRLRLQSATLQRDFRVGSQPAAAAPLGLICSGTEDRH